VSREPSGSDTPTARLIERVLSDPAFRARFRKDSAAAAREVGLGPDAATAAQPALETLEIRESKSSLAGALMAAAAEGVGLYELLDHGGLGSGVAEAAVQHPPGGVLELLDNRNVQFDAAGVADLRSGRMDPRIVTILDAVGKHHRITVSALISDHDVHTANGSVSNHHYGRAADIATVDGQPVTPGNKAAHRLALALLKLDPRLRPTELGSPWNLGDPVAFTDADHQNHIHVAFDDPIQPGRAPPVPSPDDFADPDDPDSSDSNDSSDPPDPSDSPDSDDSSDSSDSSDSDDSDNSDEPDVDEPDDDAADDDEDSGDDDEDEEDDDGEDEDGDEDGDEDDDEDEPDEDEPDEVGPDFDDLTDDERQADGGDLTDDASGDSDGDGADSSDSSDSSDSNDGSSDSGGDGSDGDGGGGGGDGGDGGDIDLGAVDSSYPGDAAPRERVAAWMAAEAKRRGLPPELPVMAALVESGMRNLPGGDADSVGYFQMRSGIWNSGPYAGYGQRPELQLDWFLDHAEQVQRDRVARSLPVNDAGSYGEWIADVERPAEQYRGRYQLRLAEARELLRHGAELVSDHAGAEAHAGANDVQVLPVIRPDQVTRRPK
jgi:hypothetical protein